MNPEIKTILQPPPPSPVVTVKSKEKEKPFHFIIANKYILGQMIGKGSFGTVHCGVSKEKNSKGKNQLVAIKLEKKGANKIPLNDFEREMYQLLYQPNKGIAKLLWSGTQGDFDILVMELIGPSLEQLLKSCGGKFSILTTILIGKQILKIINHIHSKGVVHRDIKPDNFLVKINTNMLYTIDMGLCKKFIDVEGQHIPLVRTKKFVGTLRYASLNSHRGLELSRRDDLESIMYVLIYLIKGKLPWQSIPNPKKDDLKSLIYQCKLDTTIDELCTDLPEQFVPMMHYVRGLDFAEQPNYRYLYGLLEEIQRTHWSDNNKCDWG